LVLAAPRLAPACEPPGTVDPLEGLCALVAGPCASDPGTDPKIAVLSAFPAEQRALLEATTVTERFQVNGRNHYVGTLAGRRVVLALTGIGMVNATRTAAALLAHHNLRAIVFSGVAGSYLRIGEVAVPATWTVTATGRTFPADPDLLAAAERVVAANLTLDRCTPYPLEPPGPEVCVAFAPTVVVGGTGESDDPFGGMAFPCQSDGNDLFGCEVDLDAATTTERRIRPQGEEPPAITVAAVDQETAAVAEVAAAAGVPFVGVRAVSDGPGDPLGLPGFPAQFFAYYRLAADNAAAVTMRLLEELPANGRTRRRARRLRPSAACDFERATAPECRGTWAPVKVGKLVARACALRARAAGASPSRSAKLAAKAASRWRKAAALVGRGSLPACCADALATRLEAAARLVAGGP
jgi:nucleoside phosphorylase